MHIKIKTIAYNAIIAALYVIITLLTYPISFLGIQIRISEVFILLCFFRKDYAFGLTIGCLISNLFSAIGIVDALFGTLATLLSCIIIGFTRHAIIAIFIPCVLNSLIVGFELYYFLAEPFWLSLLTVFIGELIALSIGYLILMLAFRKKKKPMELIRANQNVDFNF